MNMEVELCSTLSHNRASAYSIGYHACFRLIGNRVASRTEGYIGQGLPLSGTALPLNIYRLDKTLSKGQSSA
jgi:hypothetical protein